jgi:uncharacterized protein
MSSIDQQFVEFVVKSLVGKPEAVRVERRIDEKGVLLELTVDPEDLGRVIGKRGATAQSLRTLLRALGTKNDARYNLKIVDNGVGGYGGAPANNSVADDSAASAPSNQSDQTGQSDQSLPGASNDESAESEPEHAFEPDETSGDENSVVSKTRKELEDLDDLDV